MTTTKLGRQSPKWSNVTSCSLPIFYSVSPVAAATHEASHVSRLEWVQRHGQPAEMAGILRGRIVLRNFRRKPDALIRNFGGGDGT